MYGYDVKLVDENTGEALHGANQKGVVVIEGPLPPGCLQTLWGDDQRFVNTYWKSIPGKLLYSTFDWGVRDKDGYYFILGRTDDVINVAGHRLGTREIEESISSHPNVAEVAVVGVADQLKGQVAMAFVVAKDASALGDATARLKLEGEIMKLVDSQLGAVARPAQGLVPEFAAQDPQRQIASPRHSSGLRKARSRRPDHHRRPDALAANQRSTGLSALGAQIPINLRSLPAALGSNAAHRRKRQRSLRI
jgi:acyl-CoA synthetase (AMP-forming)/AMP-acid ligase II